MPKRMSENEFRAALRGGTTPSEAHLRKAFACEVKVASDGDRSLEFTISTAAVDRMGDTIAVEGWKLESYRKNPVVLWAHDSDSLPVAKAADIRVEDGKLKARAEFVAAEVSAFAETVFQMLKTGFLSATSVGFVPLKYAFVDDPERRFGIDFIEQELLEFSVVPVPANPEALIEAQSAGVDLAPMLQWSRGLLRRAKAADIDPDDCPMDDCPMRSAPKQGRGALLRARALVELARRRA